MSQEWGIYVAVISLLNIIGMIWLLKVTAKQPKEEMEQETTGHEWDGITELNTPLPRWWLWLFYLTIVFALGYLAVFPGLGNMKGYFGWSQENQYAQERSAYDEKYAAFYDQYLEQSHEELAVNTKAMGTAKNMFLQYCAGCHGSDGGGAIGFPNLTDQDWLYGPDEASIKLTLVNGRNGMMPGFGAAFTEEDRNGLVAYVLNLSTKTKDDPALIAKGEAKFQMMCAACHGAEAQGNQFMGAPNLADTIWLYGGRPEDLHETLINGRAGVMPAHGDILSPAKIHLLAAYVKSLSLN